MVMHIDPVAGLSYSSLKRSRARGGLSYEAIAYIAAAIDFLWLFSASTLGYIAYEYVAFGIYDDLSLHVGIGLVVSTIFVLAMSGAGAYQPEKLVLPGQQIFSICVLFTSTLAFLFTVLFFLKLGSTFSRGATLFAASGSLAGLVSIRYLWRYRLPHAIARGTFLMKQVLLICRDEFSVEPLEWRAAESGMAIAQVIRLSGDDATMPCSSEILHSVYSGGIDEVLIVWSEANSAALKECLVALRRSTLPVNVVFDGFMAGIMCYGCERIGGMAAFQTQRPPLTFLERSLKRAFDVVFALVSLAVLSPMLFIVALAVRIESKGPALFVQSRNGHGNRAFRILKFRSMTVMEDGSEIQQATRNDKRVTRVGRFIRSTSIDELPQLWNVLCGDMSVVGPRPHALAHDQLYSNLIEQYAFRRHVKPGLTGWAQVNGCRGETPTVDRMEERISYDLWYIDNWSFWLDIKIICRTFVCLQDVSKVY
ncbi:undecaprenyl-phosphate glucose phosphotransferase [Shinella sp. PSBB067]|uniref:undecaprenyl-phosphate glucose phosphotransferase n=1 Tax=Shinella sp. PSBB067 TaxID=2715959 RepID=UPI001E3BBF18|nr:undecaprenyl-phosphate glucose phosphotransferase [Shinella sp. PSBB067]